MSAKPTKNEQIVRYRSDRLPRPSTADTARLQALSDQGDETIDFGDAPALGAEAWSRAERGRFYRPVKHQLTLRLDSELVDWFKRHAKDGKGYQTDINEALREYVANAERKARKAG